jgi:hypothetical protein
MDWSRIERWEYVVTAVASEYSRKFIICEYEDIKQALYQWFAEHPNKLDTWEAIGEKDAKNLIYRSLRNEALDYCQRWKAKTVGYDVSDLYYYEPGLVEVLLPTVLMGNFHIAPKLNLSGAGAGLQHQQRVATYRLCYLKLTQHIGSFLKMIENYYSSDMLSR